MYKAAFVGFRHGHVFGLINAMRESDDFKVVAYCEEDAETRQELAKGDRITVTHDNFDEMLAEIQCDVIAIGDYYAKRGSLAIRALQAGKHVVADKPLCTDLEELETIRHLATSKGLSVGCMFDLRANQTVGTARDMILDGKLGRITQVMFTGQHPLLRETRPAWYFDGDNQRGTLNDIGSHALDIIPWMVNSSFARVTAAREWQAFDVDSDYFRDAAQCMFELENGCGVMGDVSYSAPDSFGYTHSNYWRFTVWGTKGMIEFKLSSKSITAYLASEKEVLDIPVSDKTYQSYFNAFVQELKGGAPELNTQCVLASVENALLVQQAADI